MQKISAIWTLCLAGMCGAQAAKPAQSPKTSVQQPARVTAQRQFVLNVVRSAVALPQSDPQDRLRVLGSAAGVVLPFAPAMARDFTREGARLEAEIVRNGETPAVSILSSGQG